MNNETYLKQFLVDVGLALKRAREECGLSVEEAARKTEHSINILQEVEHGSAEVLSVKSLSRIFNMFLLYHKRLNLKAVPYDKAELQCNQINSLMQSLHDLTEKIAQTKGQEG